MSLKCQDGILDHVVLIFGLFTFSLFFLVVYLLPIEVYGSTLPCDPSNLTNCEEKTSSASSNTAAGDNTQSDSAGTPLVLPDISPTTKDLGNPTTNTDPDTSDTDSVNNNNDDDTDRDNEGENDEDSGNSDDESSGGSDDGHSLIPFP
ncbi:MAG: hypothetical protein WBL68_14200 [Nitrososphaeraceae archaeon]